MFRPSKEELDALEVLGNKGWNWDSLLHYTKKVRAGCTSKWKNNILIHAIKSETFVPVPVSDDAAEKYAVKPDPTLHGTDGQNTNKNAHIATYLGSLHDRPFEKVICERMA